jgi:hypothetical protein
VGEFSADVLHGWYHRLRPGVIEGAFGITKNKEDYLPGAISWFG